MAYYRDITQEQIDKLANLITKKIDIDKEEAKNIIYEEYDLIEELLNSSSNIKDVAKKFISEVNSIYKII